MLVFRGARYRLEALLPDDFVFSFQPFDSQ